MYNNTNVKFQLSLLFVVGTVGVITFFYETNLALFINTLNLNTVYGSFFDIIEKWSSSVIWRYLSISLLLLFTIIPIYRLRYKLFFITNAIYIAYAIVYTFKGILGKLTPKEFYKSGEHGYYFFHSGPLFTSIPSGHVTTTTATFVAIYFAFGKNYIVGIVLTIIAILVAISVLLDSTHFISDTIISSYIGYLIVLSTDIIFTKNNKTFNKNI